MGALQRLERRLEDLVEGTFAKVFKGEVQPVEIAQALVRETDDKRAVVSAGRVLVPNDFVIELSFADHERLIRYAEPLAHELATMVKEHAAEEAYTLLGPVDVHFERVDSLDTGVFRVRSGVSAGAKAGETYMTSGAAGASVREAAAKPPVNAFPGAPRFSISGGEQYDRDSPQARGMEEVFFLTKPVTVIGRSGDADLQLPDGRVSRRHAEVHYEDGVVLLIDLGSTNGTLVNGQPVSRHQLLPADRVAIGQTTLVFDADETD